MKESKLADRKKLIELTKQLGISSGKLYKDEYGDWNIPVKGGTVGNPNKIFTDGVFYYIFYSTTPMAWTYFKKKLDFLEVIQDGEDEGILKLKEAMSPEESEKIRIVLKIRKSVRLTDVQAANLLEGRKVLTKSLALASGSI